MVVEAGKLDAARWRLRAWAFAALVCGAMLRVWFIVHAARIAGDTLLYGDLARNLLQHGVYGFTVSGGPPRATLIRVPGYPLFLTACFRIFGMERYVAVMCVQLGVDLGTCWLVSRLAGRLWGRRAALAALWLAALCPFTASYVAAPLTETLTLFCIAVAFYGLERWRAVGMGFNRWLWAVAAALGYGVLLRPEQGLLAAAVMPAMAWMAWRAADRASRARVLVPVLVGAVCVVLPLGPWAARNWRTFHVVEPLAPKSATDPGEFIPVGFQRWYRTWGIDFASTEAVYWNYDTDEIDVADLPTRAFDSDRQYAQTAALLNDYNETTRATPQLDRRFAAIAAERINANPVEYYVALPVARTLNMILRPRLEMLEIPLEWWKWSKHRAQTAFGVFYGALNLAYFVLAGVGLARWRRQGWDALGGAMVAYVALRCALLLTLDNSEPRYTLEFFPLLFVWGARVWAIGAGDSNSLRPTSQRRDVGHPVG